MVVCWVSDRMIGTKQEEVEPRVRNVSSQKIDRMLGSESPKVDQGKKGKAKGTFDGAIDTGAGQEIPGEKILRFKDKSAYQRFLKSAPAGVVLDQMDGLQAIRVKDGEWLKSMAKTSDMEVGKNYFVAVPEVPGEVQTMGDAFYRVVGSDALKLMGAESVSANWGKGVLLALLDTSLNPTSTSLGSEEGHGTAMASLIGGRGGAAPGAKILGFTVLDGKGTGDSFSLAKAIYTAVDQGAKVINMSLGSSGDCGVVQEAVAYALSKQVALVAATGNEAVNRVAYPAAYEGVVAVGSVDGDRGNAQHLYFSNRGEAVDVVAPGFAVVADWPGGKKVEVSGTSASTALVSGAIAAVLSREPNLTGKQAADLVIRYANDTGVAGVDEETGAGVVDLQRVFERNQRGIVDLATAGVVLDSSNGKVTVAVQNRGTETVSSPVIEIRVGETTRKFYPGSLAPGQSMEEFVQFDPVRAKQEGGIAVGANVEAPKGSDQRNKNDMWSGWFKISK
jgi:subtilisin family serine protease